MASDTDADADAAISEDVFADDCIAARQIVGQMPLPGRGSHQAGLGGVEDGSVAVHQDHGRREVEEASCGDQHVAGRSKLCLESRTGTQNRSGEIAF